MHFECEHHFAVVGARVAALMSDASFQTQLDLPDLSRPEVVADDVEGTVHLLRLRYGYVGQLDPIARKIVGGRNLTWIQELRVDVATGLGTLAFSAEEEPDRVNGTATVAITTIDDTHSRRQIAGEFRIRLPIIGGTAERKIVPGLVRRLDVEADALSAALGASG